MNLLARFGKSVDVDSELERASSGGMDVEDKMALWQNARESQHEPPPDELFVGVVDEIETGFSVHSHAIIKSNAYKWFIENLRKKISLQSNQGHRGSTAANIRETVMKSIPTGLISRKQGPKTYTTQTSFNYEWGIIARKDAFLGHVVAISSSPNFVQAMQVAEYFEQTWDSSANQLLRLIVDAIDDTRDQAVTCKLIKHSDQSRLIMITYRTYSNTS